MSVEKTLDILELFDVYTPTLTVGEMADRLKQPQSSVYRHLRVLKERGYVVETPGGYQLGYRFLKFAEIVKKNLDLVSIAKPHMRKVTQETGETSILLIRSRFAAICLEAISSPLPVKVSSNRGEVVPLYGGASSKALIAHLGDEFVDEMCEHHRDLAIDATQLKASLAEVRKNGYAFSESEIDEGVMALGMPIHNSEGEVIASLSIAGPSERFKQKSKQQMVQVLQQAIIEIEKSQ